MRLIDKKSTSGQIIYALGMGLGISVALSNRRSSHKMTKILLKEIFGLNQEPKNLTRSFSKLRQLKLVSMEQAGKETKMVLTEKGQMTFLRFNYENLQVKKNKIWDRNFRMVIFDIPEKKRKQRDLFRAKIKEMNFVKFNDSVWVYPYPCQREIDFIAHYLGIGKYVHFVLAKDLTNRERLEAFFKL